MKSLFSITLFVVLFSCNKKISEPISEGDANLVTVDSVATDLTIPETEIDSVREISTEEPDDEEQLVVILEFEKTACFGKCPSFSVQLLSDGNISYHGKANVEKIGLYESKVNDSFIYLVFQEAEKIGFFNLENSYPTSGDQLPDLPKTITYLKNGTKEHRIEDSFNSPLTLQRFEKFIWDKIEALYWQEKKVSD